MKLFRLVMKATINSIERKNTSIDASGFKTHRSPPRNLVQRRYHRNLLKTTHPNTIPNEPT
jgi:hypothetical protein